MSPEDAIAVMEKFWDVPQGGLFQLRNGQYQSGLGKEIADVLLSIEVDEAGTLPRRLVSLTWIIPTFMSWQVERVQELGGDVEALDHEIAIVRNAVDRFLGTP